MYDCKRNWLWVQSPLEEVKHLFKCIFSFSNWCRGIARRFVPPHAITPQYGAKWGTESFNVRFPLPIQLVVGNSVSYTDVIKYI